MSRGLCNSRRQKGTKYISRKRNLSLSQTALFTLCKWRCATIHLGGDSKWRTIGDYTSAKILVFHEYLTGITSPRSYSVSKNRRSVHYSSCLKRLSFINLDRRRQCFLLAKEVISVSTEHCTGKRCTFLLTTRKSQVLKCTDIFRICYLLYVSH